MRTSEVQEKRSALMLERMRWMTAMIACCFALTFISPLFAQDPTPRVQDVHYESAALDRSTDFSVVLPTEPPPSGGYPVLMILHGLGRNHHTLLENSETLALLKAQHYLVVLPDSRNGWWIDSPISGKYDSMLMEVVAEVKHRYSVSHSPSEWGVVGWSMGGFGTMHFAEHHPELVSFVGTVIGLLDFPRTKGLPEGQRFPVDKKVFGAEAAGWQKVNPSTQVESLKGKELVIVIGKQSFDRTMNHNFLRRARAEGLKPEVHCIEGAHVFGTVVHGLQILLPRAEMHFRQAERQAK